MKVSTDEGEELGTLSDVMQTGANDVYVISHDRRGGSASFRRSGTASAIGRRAGTDLRASASRTA